jgi:uncharacterized protein (TIGR03437 family)
MIALFFVQIALGAAARAQSLGFTLLPADGARPSARLDGVIAYDAVERKIFLFGGQDATGPLNDLWSYALERRRWEAVGVEGDKPAARFGHTMIFDAQRRRLIVFGGQAGGFFSDVWSFDIVAARWQRLAADNTGPSRRYGHSAIHDAARDRMVISHGFTNAGRFDDTWAFDLATGAWRNITPSGARPLRRCLHHAVYDAASSQMLLYGGCASGAGPCPLGDLWSFDLVNHRWTERTAQSSPGAPPAREHYGMSMDSGAGRLTLFAGLGGGQGSGLRDDTWVYDTRRGTWRRELPSGITPSPRARLETTFAGDRGVTYFFGGTTNAGYSDELWMLGPAFITSRPEFTSDGVRNAFSGEGGAVSPGEIISIYGRNLGPVEGIAFGYDPLTGQLPTSGPGVSVEVNGIAAPLYYARADQLNLQVPYEIAGAVEARILVRVLGQPGDAIALPLVPAHPGIVPRVWNGNTQLNTPETPAAPGGIIVLFATGHGATMPAGRSGAPYDSAISAAGPPPEPAAPVSLEVGGRPAALLYRAAAPGSVGVLQLNARIPDDAPVGSAVPVVLRIGDAQTQVTVSIAAR